MFDPKQIIIDAFVGYALDAFRETYPGADTQLADALERAARMALTTLRNCDCAYHDMEHTALVTDAGMAILRGRQLKRGDVDPETWLHAITAMLFHDVGYLRGLLKEDTDGDYVTNEHGDRINTAPTATDAAMTPWHVNRGRLYVQERFRADPVIDPERVANYIEMTRFPVPATEFHRATDSIAAMVRAADLIGQMADPVYPIKQARLFIEFRETGEAARLGLDSANDLRATFPEFFYSQVYPYITHALEYLDQTHAGRLWSGNLYKHLHGASAARPARAADWPSQPTRTENPHSAGTSNVDRPDETRPDGSRSGDNWSDVLH